MVRFRSEICKLRICDYEIVQHVVQIAQIDKSCATTIVLIKNNNKLS